MCFSAPKIQAPPPPAQFQAMQQPKDMSQVRKNGRLNQRRGFFASIATSPQGLPSSPNVTGTGGGLTGG